MRSEARGPGRTARRSRDAAPSPSFSVELECVGVGAAMVRDATRELFVAHCVEVPARRSAPVDPAEGVEGIRRVHHEVARVRVPALAQQVHECVRAGHRALTRNVLLTFRLDPIDEIHPELVARAGVHKPTEITEINSKYQSTCGCIQIMSKSSTYGVFMIMNVNELVRATWTYPHHIEHINASICSSIKEAS